MSQNTLHLEILSGPLDGLTVTVGEQTDWTFVENGLLSFPWDAELGSPQAKFYLEAEIWWLEVNPGAAHGTYCANRLGRIEGKFQLQAGDVLKASETWLCVILARDKLHGGI